MKVFLFLLFLLFVALFPSAANTHSLYLNTAPAMTYCTYLLQHAHWGPSRYLYPKLQSASKHADRRRFWRERDFIVHLLGRRKLHKFLILKNVITFFKIISGLLQTPNNYTRCLSSWNVLQSRKVSTRYLKVCIKKNRRRDFPEREAIESLPDE